MSKSGFYEISSMISIDKNRKRLGPKANIGFVEYKEQYSNEINVQERVGKKLEIIGRDPKK